MVMVVVVVRRGRLVIVTLQRESEVKFQTGINPYGVFRARVMMVGRHRLVVVVVVVVVVRRGRLVVVTLQRSSEVK